MLDSLFEFLFKFRPVVFEKGQLAFAGVPIYVAILVLVLAALVTIWGYVRVRNVPVRARVVLAILRCSAIAVIAIALLRPTLVVSSALPQQNTVAVLVDDSRSMRLPDRGGQPRANSVQNMLSPQQGSLLQQLSQRYRVRLFRFSSQSHRAEGVGELKFDGVRTRLGPALDHVRQELAGVPLSGIVLISDGADNDATPVGESLTAVRSTATPVYTIGVGSEHLASDVQVTRVRAPQHVIKGSTPMLTISIEQRGFAKTRVPLYVEDEGRIVAQQDIDLPPDGVTANVELQFPALESGARHLRVRIPVQKGELVPQNNAQETIVAVDNRRSRILYFEGEPRWEVKYLLQAVKDDDNLQVLVLQRTAEGKFLRLNVDSANELIAGFPTTRDELFRYDAIILGNVEASFFTHDQLQMMADFASRRGGGLVLLGGSHAFARGGYGGTPLENAMPVVLPAETNEPLTVTEVSLKPTAAGQALPALRLQDTDTAGSKWDKLPTLTMVNPMRMVKPGASVLLDAVPANGGEKLVGMAWQRFGRGKVVALPEQDIWVWRMHASMPLDDRTHARFWRQTLRWLVSDVEGPVVLQSGDDSPLAGEPVQLAATVNDSVFTAVNDAQVVAEVTAPSGTRTEVPLEWDVRRDGEYRASFTPDENGTYEVRIRAQRNSHDLGTSTSFVHTGGGDREYFGGDAQPTLLQRIARETGGRYYTAANAEDVSKDLQFSGSGATTKDQKDIWDMPAAFLLLVMLLSAEWAYRKWIGLA